ncbi:MAG: hypothetical protein ACLTLQ_15815 [[Clostridium] scindens]
MTGKCHEEGSLIPVGQDRICMQHSKMGSRMNGVADGCSEPRLRILGEGDY